MGSVKVTVYGRIKPCEKQSKDYKLKYGDHEDTITFGSSKTTGKKSFRFSKIFDEDATQEQVFEVVAKPVIKNVFSGYNGTIFTYGQTGSGKTYTMTGEIEDWVNTGLIPRTVKEIFRLKNQDTVISITFCEIYNEHIYDLIRVDRVDSDLEQVSLLEVSSATTHFRNLSVHVVTTAYEALQLFIRGDANKMVAETGSNARSSRSHVIFSIGLELPHPKQENLCLKPVLYLVDLAGSEKLSKCKTPMTNPYETRYINLSLHYLEQVLIALRQPGRVHIPYRNSLMTAFLRNSLGGNCITAMVATFSVSLTDSEETIQTCRFAERIALIKNEVKLNELISPEKEIDSLRKENERLKAQLKLISNEQVLTVNESLKESTKSCYKSQMTEELCVIDTMRGLKHLLVLMVTDQLNEKDKEKCIEMVRNFIQDNDYFGLPLSSVRRMEYCFHIMREEILKKTEPEKREGRKINGTLAKPVLNSNLQLEPKLSQDNRPIHSKNSRRKRSPLDLPKVNITYKRWKSTEELSEKENDDPKKLNGIEININKLNLCDGANHNAENPKVKTPINQISKNSSLVEDPTKNTLITGCFLKEKDIGITAKQRSSSFGLKFPGETKMENKNFINDNTPNASIKFDFPSPTISVVAQHVMPSKTGVPYRIFEKFNSIEIQAEEKMEFEKELHYSDEINLDQLNLKSVDSDRFSARCIPLTGDEEVDEEILKFYESRYQLFKHK